MKLVSRGLQVLHVGGKHLRKPKGVQREGRQQHLSAGQCLPYPGALTLSDSLGKK